MKFKYIFFILPFFLASQDIIDEAIDVQVDSSSLSAKAQSDIEQLDEVSKKL